MKLVDWTIGTLAALLIFSAGSGCALVPDVRQRDVVHNPFPQIKRVAVLPFFNQSNSPHVNGGAVSQAYYAALQAIPGFEVMPVGVAEIQFRQYVSQFGEPSQGADFQRMAKWMGVEAVVVGSITDYDSYYPPRMAMTTRWYAANEGFHSIPPGYGLAWGTKEADKIPQRIVREAEFELARSQLKTQTPMPDVAHSPMSKPVPGAAIPELIPLPPPGRGHSTHPADEFDFPVTASNPLRRNDPIAQAAYQAGLQSQQIVVPGIDNDWQDSVLEEGPILEGDWEMSLEESMVAVMPAVMPAGWPDPTDLIPDPPTPTPPTFHAQTEPVMSHTRLYRGDDPYFTERLADYVETGDDARGTSWQGYIKRSDDFVRFCCHLHIVEMLEARGGRDPSDLILRWPVSRY